MLGVSLSVSASLPPSSSLSIARPPMSLLSRGPPVPPGFQSQSTPNLPSARGLDASLGEATDGAASPDSRTASTPLSPAELASVEDNVPDADQDDLPLAASSGDDSDDSDHGGDTHPAAPSRYASRSQPHLAPHTASMLFPPFYNRPPTPLPPSPSLTSLLRPSFSTQTSRPTTPDSSDVDLPAAGRAAAAAVAAAAGASAGHGAATPASPATTTTTTNLASITKSAQAAPTVPRAAPKVPTYEYYGFGLYLASSAVFLMYVLWAYVPSPVLHQMGIHYYPNRWWALAVPAWLVVSVVYVYVALAAYNTAYLTLRLASCENIVDACAHVAVVDATARRLVRDQPSAIAPDACRFAAHDDVDWARLWSDGTDAVMDVPVGGVCEILYGAHERAAA